MRRPACRLRRGAASGAEADTFTASCCRVGRRARQALLRPPHASWRGRAHRVHQQGHRAERVPRERRLQRRVPAPWWRRLLPLRRATRAARERGGRRRAAQDAGRRRRRRRQCRGGRACAGTSAGGQVVLQVVLLPARLARRGLQRRGRVLFGALLERRHVRRVVLHVPRERLLAQVPLRLRRRLPRTHVRGRRGSGRWRELRAAAWRQVRERLDVDRPGVHEVPGGAALHGRDAAQRRHKLRGLLCRRVPPPPSPARAPIPGERQHVQRSPTCSSLLARRCTSTTSEAACAGNSSC